MNDCQICGHSLDDHKAERAWGREEDGVVVQIGGPIWCLIEGCECRDEFVIDKHFVDVTRN